MIRMRWNRTVAIIHIFIVVFFYILLFPCVTDASDSGIPHVKRSGSTDFCQWEMFEARCGDAQVIVMQSALYGRMKSSRCVTGTHGRLGCSVDVLWYLKDRCSGRSRCRVATADPVLHKHQQCPKDLMLYLETTYQCIDVLTDQAKKCSTVEHFDVKVITPGYLASVVSAFKSLATVRCPLRLTANEGQTLRLLLSEFGRRRLSNEEEEIATVDDVCYRIGQVKDASSVVPLKACVTGGARTEVILYQSRTNNISLQLENEEMLLNLPPFVIKYEAHGCPALPTISGTWNIKDGNTVTIGCNGTEERWKLLCNGGMWIGDYRNCSSTERTYSAGFSSTSNSGFPVGILLVVAIGVALGVFIGGILLTIVAFVMRRGNKRAQMEDSIYNASDIYRKQSRLSGSNVLLRQTSSRRGDGYYGISASEQHFVPSTATVPQDTDTNLIKQYALTQPLRNIRSDHLYECPHLT